MKLTNRTIPPAKNYQCNKCRHICNHKEMYDDDICYDCYDETKRLAEEIKRQ